MPYLKRKRYSRKPYKTSRRGKYSRRPSRTFQSRVTQVLMKKAETKYFDIGIQNVQLYHNCGEFITLWPGYETAIVDWFNPWSKIPKGTGRMNRIGDQITPRGMSIKLFIASKADHPNNKYRILIVTLPKVVNGVVTTARFDFRQTPNSGAAADNNLIVPVDKDKGVKVLYDKVCNVSSKVSTVGTSGFEMTLVHKIWIKRKRASNILFDTTDTDIVNKPLAVYVIPYDQYSTLETSNTASCTGIMRMYYKDI